nr:hypothetical protein Iba_chr15dCG7350 [Ipomoea batatas]
MEKRRNEVNDPTEKSHKCSKHISDRKTHFPRLTSVDLLHLSANATSSTTPRPAVDAIVDAAIPSRPSVDPASLHHRYCRWLHLARRRHHLHWAFF